SVASEPIRLDMRPESDPRSRIAWQPETPMRNTLWERGSLHEAIISTTGSKSSAGRPIGKWATAPISGMVSILGMLLEPGEPAQASFSWQLRDRASPRSKRPGEFSASTTPCAGSRGPAAGPVRGNDQQQPDPRGPVLGLITASRGILSLQW